MAPLDPLILRWGAQEPLLLEWRGKAEELIDRKLDDAEAHGVKALTDALKTTPDGRPTVRRAAQSRSYKAAANRLDELLEALAGPAVNSLTGLIRDAREAFYISSFASWLPFIPEHLWAVPDPKPTQNALIDVRRIVLHGYELREELATPVMRAKRSLLAALGQAGLRSTPDHVAMEILAGWRLRAGGSLKQVVATVLSDSQARADVIADRNIIHSKYFASVE